MSLRKVLHDALGRMVETDSGGTYTQVIYQPSGQKLADLQEGALLKAFIPLPGGGTAIYNSSGLAYIRHKDYLGSSRLATTWGHGVQAKEAYAPFGETYNESGTPDRSFTGKDQDTTSGMYDFMFRRYDPTAGRWLSPDPAGWTSVNTSNPQSLNRYAYVDNNPMSAVDPNGLACVYVDQNGDVSIDNSSDNLYDTCHASGGTYVPGALEMSDLYTLPGYNGSYINNAASPYGGNPFSRSGFGVRGGDQYPDGQIYQGQIQYSNPEETYLALQSYMQMSAPTGAEGYSMSGGGGGGGAPNKGSQSQSPSLKTWLKLPFHTSNNGDLCAGDSIGFGYAALYTAEDPPVSILTGAISLGFAGASYFHSLGCK